MGTVEFYNQVSADGIVGRVRKAVADRRSSEISDYSEAEAADIRARAKKLGMPAGNLLRAYLIDLEEREPDRR